MRAFKDTRYGDLTGKAFQKEISVSLEVLTSLEGSPEIVTKKFDCSNNELTTLKYAPEKVGDFHCSSNKLTTLEDGPKEVMGTYKCSRNKLTTLKGAPTILGGIFDCSNNELTSLEFAPKQVGSMFYCKGNKINNVKQEIIKNKIKATYYWTDEGDFGYDEIEKMMDLDKRVSRSSMRTLLGLDK